MKRYFGIMIAALLCAAAFAGCNKIEDNYDGSMETIAGSWQLTSVDGTEVEAFAVYVSFDAAGNFELYQQLNESWFERYTGRYCLEDGILSGTYSDGVPFNTDYECTVSESGRTLTLTEINEYATVNVYERASIPSDIIWKPGADVRSAHDGEGRRAL